MCHPVLGQLLLILERTSTDITITLQRILFVMIDPFVFHPSSVACKNCAALPTADVRFDARVRVEVTFHVSLECRISVSQGPDLTKLLGAFLSVKFTE